MPVSVHRKTHLSVSRAAHEARLAVIWCVMSSYCVLAAMVQVFTGNSELFCSTVGAVLSTVTDMCELCT